MVEIRFDKRFEQIFSKLKEPLLRSMISKQVKKIIENPAIGKPMKHDRKGTRELYVKPFRLSYLHDANEDLILVLDLYHKKKQ